MELSPTKPTTNFTKASNEILLSTELSDQEKITWLQLQSLCIGDKTTNFAGMSEVASELCRGLRSLQRTIKLLEERGLVERDGSNLTLFLPSDVKEPEEKKQSKEAARIAAARAAQSAWNDNAPDSYVRIRKVLSLKVIKAIEIHMAHLKAEGTVADFIKTVCKGAKAHVKFWANANARPEWIFGAGDPTEKKIGHVSELYRLGTSAKGTAASFDVNDDACWLEWFASKELEVAEVARLVMDRFDAWTHESENEGNKILYIYSNKDGDLVHWTYKEGHVGVSSTPTAK